MSPCVSSSIYCANLLDGGGSLIATPTGCVSFSAGAPVGVSPGYWRRAFDFSLVPSAFAVGTDSGGNSVLQISDPTTLLPLEKAYPCPSGSATCVGNATGTAGTGCEAGGAGTLCLACQPSYFLNSGVCVPCTNKANFQQLVLYDVGLFVAVALVLAAVALYVGRAMAARARREEAQAERRKLAMEGGFVPGYGPMLGPRVAGGPRLVMVQPPHHPQQQQMLYPVATGLAPQQQQQQQRLVILPTPGPALGLAAGAGVGAAAAAAEAASGPSAPSLPPSSPAPGAHAGSGVTAHVSLLSDYSGEAVAGVGLAAAGMGGGVTGALEAALEGAPNVASQAASFARSVSRNAAEMAARHAGLGQVASALTGGLVGGGSDVDGRHEKDGALGKASARVNDSMDNEGQYGDTTGGAALRATASSASGSFPTSGDSALPPLPPLPPLSRLQGALVWLIDNIGDKVKIILSFFQVRSFSRLGSEPAWL